MILNVLFIPFLNILEMSPPVANVDDIFSLKTFHQTQISFVGVPDYHVTNPRTFLLIICVADPICFAKNATCSRVLYYVKECV